MKTHSLTRKRNFLSGDGNFPQLNDHFSPLAKMVIAGFCLLTLLVAKTNAAPAQSSSQTAHQQVYAKVAEQVEADINREAKSKDWQGHTVKPNIFIPNEVRQYKRCVSPLQVALPGGNVQNLSRLRYDISCHDDGNVWTVGVTVKPDVYLPILVTKTTIERGELVTPSSIELKRHNISNLHGAFLTNPDDVVGLTAKRRIRPLQPLSTSMLDMPILVTRGQKVIMIASQGGIEARMIGEAMKNGRKGDLIPVKNLSSNKTINAVVDQSGVVKMPMAMGSGE